MWLCKGTEQHLGVYNKVTAQGQPLLKYWGLGGNEVKERFIKKGGS